MDTATNNNKVEPESSEKMNTRMVLVVFVALLIDLLAFTMILPLLPALLDYYGHNSQVSQSKQCLVSWQRCTSGAGVANLDPDTKSCITFYWLFFPTIYASVSIFDNSIKYLYNLFMSLLLNLLVSQNTHTH